MLKGLIVILILLPLAACQTQPEVKQLQAHNEQLSAALAASQAEVTSLR